MSTPGHPTQRASVRWFRGDSEQIRHDQVVTEEPLEIRLEFQMASHWLEKSIMVTMRTPGQDFALAAGFLLSEGIVHHPDDIERFDYCIGQKRDQQHYNKLKITLRPNVSFDPERLLRHVYTTSSCGICGKASIEALELQGCPTLPKHTPSLPIHRIYALPQQLREAQQVFEKTGGLHAAALFSHTGQLLAIHEDVGRHNAVDKLLGEQFLKHQLPAHEALVFVSGRVSFEIVQKVLQAGIPILAAVSAPSSLAINLADQFGMTLLGFVREQRCNVYTHGHRIQSPHAAKT